MNTQFNARIIINYDNIIGTKLQQVELMDNYIIFNTSKFSGFDYPFISFVLPLQEIRILLVNNTFNVIINVFRNVSNILSPRPME